MNLKVAHINKEKPSPTDYKELSKVLTAKWRRKNKEKAEKEKRKSSLSSGG